ncbi:MAG: hypothetical protein ACREA2_08315 [Blastocatellia bacterium]
MPDRDPLKFLQRQQQPKRDPLAFLQREQPPQSDVGDLDNLLLGMQQEGAGSLAPAALSGFEALGSAMTGDFGPAREIAELAGRGVGRLLMGGNPSFAGWARANEDAIARIHADRQSRRQGNPIFESIAQTQAELEAEAARDPSLRGRITRGAGRLAVAAAPAVTTGIASGGSIPAVAAVTAAQSLDRPENLPLNVGLSALPVPALRNPRAFLSRVIGRARTSPETALPASIPRPAFGASAAPEPLPRYQFADELPELIDAPPKPFTVSLAAERTKAPGAYGPRVERNVMEFLTRNKAQPASAPAQPKTPLLDQILAVRKAGLLTGPTTHIRNVGGTGLHLAAEEVSRIPAAIVDLAVSAATKRRTVTLPSFMSMARSSREAATKGVKEAGEVLRKGLPEADAAALNLVEINSGSKLVNAYTRGVFRSLGAADRLFRSYALRNAIEDRARSLALTEARQGLISRPQIATRTKELIAAMPEDQAAAAILDAERAIFQNSNLVSRGIEGVKTGIEGMPGAKAVTVGIDLIMPFKTTPANVIARALEYAGGGYAKSAYVAGKAIIKRSMSPEQQRQFAQSFGRATTGAGGFVTLGYILGKNDLATGFSEDRPSLRARDEAAGRQPGAIYDPITNKWRRISGFSPIGTLITLGAHLAREGRRAEDDEDSSTLGRIGSTALEAVSEAPLSIGIKEASEAITRPGSLPERLGRIGGSFVPTIVSQVGELTDDSKREAEGFTEQIQRRLPGLRNLLPERHDALGRPLPSTPGDLIDPTAGREAQDKTHPVLREFKRLDIGISRPQRRQGETAEEHRESARKFGREYGALTERIVHTMEYWQLDDERRREVFEVARRYLQARERGEVGVKSPGEIIYAAKENVARRKAKIRK